LIVVDASVLVCALADDGRDGERVRTRMLGERLMAPEVIDLEVASVFRRLCAGGSLPVVRAEQAISDLFALRLDRVRQQLLIQRCWELRHNLTVYDAAYVALAEATSTTLVTADERLANSPRLPCQVELLRVGR
jgi:predicted nucleic acid-binding protein